MAKLKFSNRYILIIIALSLFFFAFVLIYEDIKNRTVNEFNIEQLILAKTASQGIASFFNDYQSDLTFLSQLSDIIDFKNDGKELLADFYETHRSILAAITRVDARGIILYTYPLNQSVIGSDISYQKHVSQVMATHQPVISDVFMSAQGYLAIAVHVPVFKEKTYAGSLAILIPIDEIGKLFLGKIKVRGTGNVWLLSENGIEIYCPVTGHTGRSFLEITHNDASAVKLLENIKTEKSGTARSIHKEEMYKGKYRFNEKYIAYYRTPLGNTFWTILISYQVKDIYIALTRLRNRLILVFSLLFMTIAYYFFSLAKVRNVLKEEAKRKEAEKILLESEEKFRRIFEDHSAVKLLIDPDSGDIMDANKAAAVYYGWSREELKRMKIEQINSLTNDEIKKNIENVISHNRMFFEFRHRLKDGTLRDVEVFSSKIEIGNKNLLHSIIHDITDRKQVEEALIMSKEKAEESDRLKTAFLQNMSHEIRTPMNAIMGFSSLLVENYNNKPKLEKFSGIINLRCNDLLEIINDILDISKIESGQLPLNFESCNLNELFTELTAYFREQQKRNGKELIDFNLKAFCDPSEIGIITDKVKLRQIFINLISNAFKFTESGKIEGGCKYEANQNLVFYVSDTGIGIPRDKQDVIFNRFAQLNIGASKLISGTGLGLSIVKGLVELMGGKIWLESEVEKGTTFYFSIPFKIVKTVHAVQVPVIDSHEYNFSGKTILLVDDDHINAYYIKEILYDTGMNIINAESGNDAIQMAISQSPDLVLMDIRLPDMSGYEAVHQIKQTKPDLLIIAQTAYATNEDKQKALDAGCIDYISKPLKRDLLLYVIKKYLLKH
jgi:PAS domain S-box-containing protein